MKNIRLILSIVLAISLSSCDDWLDVKPKSQVEEEDMFSSETGFQNALTGVYLGLKDKPLYGEELTLSMLEFLSYHWDAPSSNLEAEALLNYEYNQRDVVSTVKNTYAKMYNVIANVNSILANIDSDPTMFSDGMYELIKGECLTIRAYCHFDLLRLFGPMPQGASSESLLAYVTSISTEYNTPIAYSEFVSLIEKDLNDAENLLKDKDPVVKYSMDDLNQLDEGDFQPYDNYSAFRRYRMNYYATLGLKARFYLWTQNKEEAFKYANMVISAINPDNTSKFKLGTVSDLLAGDYTLTNEHLIGLHVYNLQETYEDLFSTGRYGLREGVVEDQVFKNEVTDIRLQNLWVDYVSGSSSSTILKKYKQDDNSDYLKKQVIPLLRLSEMYLIAMETATISESNDLLQKFAASRDFAYEPFADELDRQERIIAEYNKEFWGEGQMFYTYKRLAVENILFSTITMSKEQYVVPVPEK